MLRMIAVKSCSLLVLVACPLWAGCSTDPSVSTDVGRPDAQASELDAGEAGDGGVTHRADAADASSPLADAAMFSCSVNEPCGAGQGCYRDDGSVYHECRCSGGAFACSDIGAAPPTDCVAGGVCPTAGATCSVYDGTAPAYCACTAGHWACMDVPHPSASCSIVDGVGPCLFPPDPSAPEWIACVAQSPGTVDLTGVRCTDIPGGVAAETVSFERVCPSVTPTTGTACDANAPASSDFYYVLGLYCGCTEPSGASCVCGCRSPGPSTLWPQWLCLP